MEKLPVMDGQEYARIAVEVPVRRTNKLMTFRPFFHRSEKGSNTLVRTWQESAIRGFLAGTERRTIQMVYASTSLTILLSKSNASCHSCLFSQALSAGL